MHKVALKYLTSTFDEASIPFARNTNVKSCQLSISLWCASPILLEYLLSNTDEKSAVTAKVHTTNDNSNNNDNNERKVGGEQN